MSAPLPPRRPAELAPGGAAPPKPTAPRASGGLAEPPPLDVSIPPPALPKASRERMRQCAEDWTRLKLETKRGLPVWREYATQCLTR